MKARILSLIGAAAVIVSAFAAAYFLPSSRRPSAPAARTVSSGTAASRSAPAVDYTVRTYGSGIGVFIGTSSKPEQVVDISPDTLPKTEREKLNVGIHVSSRDELAALLQDYST